MDHQVQVLWDREPPLEYCRGRAGPGPTAKTLVETFGLPFNPSVIVSTEFEDKERLAAIVKNLGFAVTYTDVPWPRDIIHQYGNKIATKKSHPDASTGGLYVIDDINGRLGFASTRGHTFSIWDSKNQNSSVFALERFFGIEISMISPLGLSHADSDVMIAPPYVIADSLSYHARPSKGMLNRDAYDAVQDKGYELVVLNLGSEGAYKPLNSLVLNNGGRPFVIANSMTPNFLGELDNLGINYETVTADRSPLAYNGSIRCRTNYLSNAYLLECYGYKVYDAS